MEGRDLFTRWAPQEGYAWTRYAKPAMFMHPPQDGDAPMYIKPLPQDLAAQITGGRTAVIVDLPGAESVAAGLDLAGVGFRPVPLYNGIHIADFSPQHANGENRPADFSPQQAVGENRYMPAPGRRNAVDNQPIINALHEAIPALEAATLPAHAPPAFLLDAARNDNLVPSLDFYDNRWSLDLDDMPDFMYLQAQGITRIVIWTDRNIQDDVRRIGERYQSAGIEVFTYIQAAPVTDAELTEAVRKFEWAKLAVWLMFGMAAVNIIGMFLVRGEPFLWTAPTVMWLTYLWVPESVGDVFALGLAAGYFVLAILLPHRRRLLGVVFAAVALETVILFIYAGWYGFAAYTGYSFLYGLAVFGIPVVVVWVLWRAWRVLPMVVDVEPARYQLIADTFYEPRMRTGFRGFRGYGGSGYGGYGGSYGGYGGFGG